MLTEFWIRDETICSLGKTEHTITIHHSGKTTSLCELTHPPAEIAFHPGTSVKFLIRSTSQWTEIRGPDVKPG